MRSHSAPLSRLLAAARSWIFRLSHNEVSFDRRRFAAGEAAVRAHLERAGGAFVDGFNAAMKSGSVDDLRNELAAVPVDLTGFAYEGSGMALALLDLLMPFRRSRWQRFAGVAGDHIYLVHVGAGWALARLNRRAVPRWLGCDPLLEPLVHDGYGFHEAFFDPERTVRAHRRPPFADRGSMRVFDQGVGRSLWFIECAQSKRIAETIGGFPSERIADLWSGVGLAAAYAGGAPRETLSTLAESSVAFRGDIGQGVVFAARARQRAGNLTAATEMAAEIFCGIDAASAADIAEEASRGLPRDGSYDTYEQWRGRIRHALAREGNA
jgi:hypothetical protein